MSATRWLALSCLLTAAGCGAADERVRALEMDDERLVFRGARGRWDTVGGVCRTLLNGGP